MFGTKPSLKQQQRENERTLRKAGREMEQEKRKLEEAERRLQEDIRKKAAQGKKEECRILAKQLVAIRKQKSRTMALNSKITASSHQNKCLATNVALANVLRTTAGTMADMNSILKPEAISGTIRNFQKANMQMEMTDEMINDTLDELLDDSGDEIETNSVVNQVLDEIGIEISSLMPNAPSTHAGKDSLQQREQRTNKSKDLLEQLDTRLGS